MKRRSIAGGEPTKGRRRKTTEPKRSFTDRQIELVENFAAQAEASF